jgi:hypothetical protein
LAPLFAFEAVAAFPAVLLVDALFELFEAVDPDLLDVVFVSFAITVPPYRNTPLVLRDVSYIKRLLARTAR